METISLEKVKKIPVWVGVGLDEVQKQVTYIEPQNEIPKELNPQPKLPTLKEVVCKAFNIPEEDLFIKRRFRRIVAPRQLYMYIICDLMNAGPKQTARHTGWDHSTAIYCRKTYNNLRDTDKNYREITDNILKSFNAGDIELPNIYESVIE